jgi:hypothetical protein
MARIRTIKPEFWTSEQISECSVSARLLFIGMWNFCDDEGRCKCSPNELRMRIYPGDECSADAVASWIDELVTNDLVTIYEADNQLILQVNKWSKHQLINRKTASKFPSIFDEGSVRHHGTLTTGREGKGKEGRRKGRERGSPTQEKEGSEAVESGGNGSLPKKDQAVAEVAFEILWQRWQWYRTPKGPRWKAAEAWQVHVVAPGVDLAAVLGAAGAYCAQCIHTDTDTAHVVTWINQHRWLDDHGLEGVDSEAAMVAKQRAEMLAAWRSVTGEDLEVINEPRHARLAGPAGEDPTPDL